jgi:hypothetical protein
MFKSFYPVEILVVGLEVWKGKKCRALDISIKVETYHRTIGTHQIDRFDY